MDAAAPEFSYLQEIVIAGAKPGEVPAKYVPPVNGMNRK